MAVFNVVNLYKKTLLLSKYKISRKSTHLNLIKILKNHYKLC